MAFEIFLITIFPSYEAPSKDSLHFDWVSFTWLFYVTFCQNLIMSRDS